MRPEPTIHESTPMVVLVGAGMLLLGIAAGAALERPGLQPRQATLNLCPALKQCRADLAQLSATRASEIQANVAGLLGAWENQLAIASAARQRDSRCTDNRQAVAGLTQQRGS